MAKKIKRKKTQTTQKSGIEAVDVKKEAQKLAKEVVAKLKLMKRKFDHLDEKTKKEIVIGATGLAALVLGKKVMKGFKKQK